MQVDYINDINLAIANVEMNNIQLVTLLSKMGNSILQEFTSKKTSYLTTVHKLTHDDKFYSNFHNASILYYDYFRKITRKIENLIVAKNPQHDKNEQIVSYHSGLFTEDEKKKYSAIFNSICSYQKKGNEEMNLYSDSKFCSYVISKTYKKTYNELTDFMGLVLMEESQFYGKDKIRIAAIGGGSGSDGLAVADILASKLGNKVNIQVDVFDLNFEAWKISNCCLIEKLYGGSNIKLNWNYLNHMQNEVSTVKEYDFVTFCWTLNEHSNFNDFFWNALLENNPSAVYLGIEGEVKYIDKLNCLFRNSGFENIYFEKNANPRRLFAQKSQK